METNLNFVPIGIKLIRQGGDTPARKPSINRQGLSRYLAKVALLLGSLAWTQGFEQLTGKLDLPFHARLLVMNVAMYDRWNGLGFAERRPFRTEMIGSFGWGRGKRRVSRPYKGSDSCTGLNSRWYLVMA
ncbi:hypothetical protein JHW44_00570 [Paracoccus seriniphilus]|nr:hypothetical protein JHW44_00570 [Paracoccus seriniphilus]